MKPTPEELKELMFAKLTEMEMLNIAKGISEVKSYKNANLSLKQQYAKFKEIRPKQRMHLRLATYWLNDISCGYRKKRLFLAMFHCFIGLLYPSPKGYGFIQYLKGKLS